MMLPASTRPDFLEDAGRTAEWVASKNLEFDGYLREVGRIPTDGRVAHVANGSERMARPPRTVGAWTYSRRWRGGSIEFVRTRWDDPEELTRALAGEVGAGQILGSDLGLADGSAYCTVMASEASPDGAHWAVLVDRNGDEHCSLEVRRAGGQPDQGAATVWAASGDSCVWSADSKRLYFLDLNDRWRPWRVLCWDLDHAEVTEIFREPDEAFDLALSADASGRRLVVESAGSEDNYFHIVDVTDIEPRLTVVRKDGASRHAVAVIDDQMFVLHDADNSAGSIEVHKLVAGQELVPSRAVREGSSQAIYQDLWAVNASTALASVLVDGIHQLHVVDLAHGDDWQVDWDEPLADVTYVDVLEAGDVWSFSSMTYLRGPRFHKVSIGSRHVETLGNWLPAGDQFDHVAERAWVTVDDGVNVPLTVLRPAGVALGSDTAVLLTAYGCYGGVARPRPRPEWLHCLSAGLVVVFAHVRGGGERGSAWWRAGADDKRRSIDDFLAVAEHLHVSGLVASDGLGVEGHSAGGAIVAAAVNKRPELFSAVLLDAPFVDILHDLLDATLPLTVQDWPEWGNPGASEADYDYVRSYSPVDNVAAQRYPACLTTAAENDIRVPVTHAYHWTAAVESAVSEVGAGGPAMLRIHGTGGHQGAGAAQADNDVMERVYFLLHELKVQQRRSDGAEEAPENGATTDPGGPR